jgi:hypothetical protein
MAPKSMIRIDKYRGEKYLAGKDRAQSNSFRIAVFEKTWGAAPRLCAPSE